MRRDGRMSDNEPKKNGICVYGVTLPPDLEATVLKMANEANLYPHEVIVNLAVQGARCAKQGHDGKLGG